MDARLYPRGVKKCAKDKPISSVCVSVRIQLLDGEHTLCFQNSKLRDLQQASFPFQVSIVKLCALYISEIDLLQISITSYYNHQYYASNLFVESTRKDEGGASYFVGVVVSR